MLLAIDLYKDFIDGENVSISTMALSQSPCIFGTKLDAPEPDRFVADDDTSLSKQILDISVAQIEAIVEPEYIGKNIWKKPVALVSIRPPILPTSAC